MDDKIYPVINELSWNQAGLEAEMWIDELKSNADFHASNVTAIGAAIATEQATIDNSNATAVDKAMATAAKEWLTSRKNDQ